MTQHLCKNPSSSQSNCANIDPLAFYESQSVGNEFTAYIPRGDERRGHVMRRDQMLVKNWRGVSKDKHSNRGECMNTMRNSETQRIVNSERMFLVVLATMTLLLGSIFAYFVMNFGF